MATIATVVTLVVVGIAGEVAVRYRERNRSTMPGTMPQLFYRHSRLGHAMVRNYDYYGWIHINGQGFRGAAETPLAKAPGTLRVMAVGGSTTFDSFVGADSAAWPARLAHWLHTLAPDKKIEIINAGVPGYRVLETSVQLQSDLIHYKPDVVLFYHGHNDLFGALQSGGYRAPGGARPGEVPTVTPWRAWFERHSLLYTKVVGKLQAISFRRRRAPVVPPGSTAVVESALERGVARFEGDVTAFMGLARAYNLRVIVPEVVQISGTGGGTETDPGLRQAWALTVPAAPVDTVLLGYQRYNDVLRRVTAKFDVPFVPTASFGLRGQANYVDGDPIHFSARGADEFAHQLAQALLSRHLLD
jgi:lysophospholipase L1-like esterase